jgi:hypothetical protein
MRDYFNLLDWDSEYKPQKKRGMFAHDNKTLGTPADFLHNSSLSGVWLAKYRVQSGHHWHLEILQQLQDITAGFTSINPILVLQAHYIDTARIKGVGCCPVRKQVVLGYLKTHARRICIART